MHEILNLVVGTAGHIDHGKSSLVKALTGIDPDRLKEEKERGLTIDLGFAPWKTPDGRLVGFVDVPGHEKFVKNMVAGATGLDFVILVVAANDGVMPQTREHLEIMQILGIQAGMVALTKIDTVPPDLVMMAEEEVRNLLKGTFLEKSPIVGLSNTTGEGLATFQQKLFEELLKLTPRSYQGVFRMPIQRVFSKHGYGTVITGIPISGSIHVGEEIEILPGNVLGKVRKIHAYGQEVDEARAGHSTALNIKDVVYKEIERGQVAAAPDSFEAVSSLEAKFSYLAGAKGNLQYLTPIRFHTGTLEEMGKIAILGKPTLAPGETSFVQIRLDRPILAAAGDPFVLRLSSPTITIGGGIIIGSCGRKLKRFREEVAKELFEKEQSLTSLESKLELEIRKVSSYFVKEGELLREMHLAKEELENLLQSLLQKGIIIKLGVPFRYLHRETLEELEIKIKQALERFFHENPHRLYLKKIPLRNFFPGENMLFDFVLHILVEKGQLVQKEDKIFLAGRSAVFSSKEQILLKKIEQCYLDSLFQPPALEELPSLLGSPLREITSLFEFLGEEETLVEITRGLFFHKKALAQARTLVIEIIEKEGELISAAFRDRLNTTRKYVIPLLDYFDAVGLTVRTESSRVLKKK